MKFPKKITFLLDVELGVRFTLHGGHSCEFRVVDIPTSNRSVDNILAQIVQLWCQPDSSKNRNFWFGFPVQRNYRITRGVFRGAIGPWPPLAQKFFFTLKKNWKTWLAPSFVWALVASKNLAPPFRNPKYATENHDQTHPSMKQIIIWIWIYDMW